MTSEITDGATDIDTNVLSTAETECLQKLRVALATTVIRNKPRGLTSKQFAARLSEQLRSGEQNWKDKARKLEEELLSLRQKLVLAELDEGGGRPDVSLEDDFYTPEFAVCPPSTSEADYDVSVLTPPSSSEALPRKNNEKLFLSNANFLSSLSRLESSSSSLDSKLSREKTREVTVQSIQNMSRYYQNWLGLEHLPKWAVEKGPMAIVAVLDSSTLDDHRKESLKECQVLIECCVRSILTCRKLCRTGFLASAAMLVTTLARSPHLQKTTLQFIIDQVKEVGGGLRSVISDETPLDIVSCENVICLFQIIENVISGTVGSKRNKQCQLEQDILKELRDRLEDCILHLTDVFPLFSQYVWNILGTMELMVEDSGGGE